MDGREVKWVIYGTQLSPYALKVAAALASSNRPFLWHWQQGIHAQIYYEIRTLLLKNRLLPLSIPRSMSALEEFPLVPFLFGSDGTNAYDSSSILKAMNIDLDLSKKKQFLSCLVEEFVDEWGLYLVHHKRWSDPSNPGNRSNLLKRSPGQYLATEMNGNLLAFQSMRNRLGRFFNHRQTRRLPYLFSVDAQDSEKWGLPQTCDLLNGSFDRMLAALELIYCGPTHTQTIIPATCNASRNNTANNEQPADTGGIVPAAGLSGRQHSGKLCAADLSIFGQFNMNAHLDPGTREHMLELAPGFVTGFLDRVQVGAVLLLFLPSIN
jgi:hypothetical protein